MPEFWVTEYPATSSDPATAGLCCITGFVAGARAEEMSALSQTTVVTRSLAQLDQIFGGAPTLWQAALPREASEMTVMTVSHGQLKCQVSSCDGACSRAAGAPERRHPATSAFVRAHVEDWSRSPYIGGAYSYPSLGARPGDR